MARMGNDGQARAPVHHDGHISCAAHIASVEAALVVMRFNFSVAIVRATAVRKGLFACDQQRENHIAEAARNRHGNHHQDEHNHCFHTWILPRRPACRKEL